MKLFHKILVAWLALAALAFAVGYGTRAPQGLFPDQSQYLYGTCPASTGGSGSPLICNLSQVTAEAPTSGTFSTSFFVPSTPQQPTAHIKFELMWCTSAAPPCVPANPGAFNIQIQDADTDITQTYVTLPSAGTITSSPLSAGAGYISRVELNPWEGLYGRLYVNTQAANSVFLIAKVSR